MSAWTPERREKMARMMEALQPWKKSTGPKTPEGKQRASRNGSKRGAGAVASCGSQEQTQEQELAPIPPEDVAPMPPIETAEAAISEEEKQYRRFRGMLNGI